MSKRLQDEAARRIFKLLTDQRTEILIAGFDESAIEVYGSLRENFIRWIIDHSGKLSTDQFRLFMVHIQQLLEILIELKKLKLKYS